MSKKDFDMSQLVSGLTGEQEEKNENRTQTVKRKKPMEHVCTLVSVEQMAKVRTIAEREGIALKDIFAVGLNMAISSYEQKYGEIKVRKTKRGNASEVFGMEYEQARTDRHTDSEQGRSGLVHLQLGKAERHVDPGTKGSAAYH